MSGTSANSPQGLRQSEGRARLASLEICAGWDIQPGRLKPLGPLHLPFKPERQVAAGAGPFTALPAHRLPARRRAQLGAGAMQAWQDENSAAALHRKGRPGGAQGLAGAWAGQGALPGKLLPGASARKALGNITNQQGVRPYGAALGPHKALGSAVPAQQGPAEPQAECSQAALAHSAAAPELDVDRSPEKRAGMGWQELERAREAHTDAEISARLAAIADAPSCNPVFWPASWRAGALGAAEQRPRPPTRPPSPESPGLAAAVAADDLEVYRDDWSLDVYED